jgi:hypothetical protein
MISVEKSSQLRQCLSGAHVASLDHAVPTRPINGLLHQLVSHSLNWVVCEADRSGTDYEGTVRDKGNVRQCSKSAIKEPSRHAV